MKLFSQRLSKQLAWQKLSMKRRLFGKSGRKKPENMLEALQCFLTARYNFRYNLLTEQTEYRGKEMPDEEYGIVAQRDLNTFCLEARSGGINCWDKDVSRLLHSRKVENYHPFLHYMSHLPQWDGVDRVTPLAVRISRKPMWVKGFHRWMLGVAAQWLGQAQDCANAVAPMLVSREHGKRKSSFCKILMPKELTPYYIDKFDLTSESGCEQKLSLFGLINMDEFDKYRAGQMPALKNLMQMTTLTFRRAHRPAFSHLPRIASFIGTSNMTDLLTDPTGSRRFLCAEVDDKIDCTPPDHAQLFAQLKAELSGGERYWFSEEEEKEIQHSNRNFYKMPAEQELFLRCFRMPQEGELSKPLYHDGFVQLFAETLSGGHAWGDSEPVGQDDGCIGDTACSYRVWQCVPAGEAEGFFRGLILFRCDPSAGTPFCKEFAGGLKLLKDFSGGIV